MPSKLVIEPVKSWQWRSQPLANRCASEVFAALFGDQAIATLLESPGANTNLEQPQLCRYSLCAGSPRVIEGKQQLWTPEIGQILPFLRSLLAGNESVTENSNNSAVMHLPFTGGWFGWLGYDLAWEIEQLPNLNQDTLPFPVAFWYEPECFAVLDHVAQTLWLAAGNSRQLDELESKLQRFTLEQDHQLQDSTTSEIAFLTNQEQYQHAVTQAKQHIQAGDIFQTNLSLRFKTQTTRDSWSIYRQLQKINPSPFASYWRSPWGDVISCSPERLIQLEGNKAQTRPIAGTRSRGKDPESDRALAAELLANTKERAEHIMLVDLERNDLGRVCEWGSVEVDELLVIERYSHVMHLVSNVKGILKSDRNAVDLLKAVYPGGTITGCPKVRCMELIEALEPVRRSLFYGSCGYLDQRGNLDLNILIRTLLYVKSANDSIAEVYGQVGAGIVDDSDR
ncbi:MAG: anthranilate synthase component I [Cyanobacteria bacterium P01_C01_bin.72]